MPDLSINLPERRADRYAGSADAELERHRRQQQEQGAAAGQRKAGDGLDDDEEEEEHFFDAIPSLGGRRSTLCVSSEVGCAMGCTFCATGRHRRPPCGWLRAVNAGASASHRSGLPPPDPTHPITCRAALLCFLAVP